MSILTSTNTGKINKLNEYFNELIKKYSEYSCNIKNINGEFEVRLKCSKFTSNIITIDAKTLPVCKLYFDENCIIKFLNFTTKEDFNKIITKELINREENVFADDFLFEKCIFNKKLFKYVITKFTYKIRHSTIYTESNCFYIYKNFIKERLNHLANANNKIITE